MELRISALPMVACFCDLRLKPWIYIAVAGFASCNSCNSCLRGRYAEQTRTLVLTPARVDT
jgi:hypothetical protein